MSEPARGVSRRAMRRSYLRAKKARRRMKGLTVIGEVLVTLSLFTLLFLGWQLWWNDAILAGQQSTSAGELSRKFTGSHPTKPQPTPSGTDYGEPVIGAAPSKEATPFAVMYVPRFNSPGKVDSQRTIAQGYGLDVLNSYKLGVGHYPATQMPGQIGNFAIASHRSAYGGGMHEIEQLRFGDAIYIQTSDGWYTYRFRDFEYVTPGAVEVLAPVPHHPGISPTDRIVTLTTCNPLYSTAERIIAYGVLDSWRPASAGPPPDIAQDVQKWSQ